MYIDSVQCVQPVHLHLLYEVGYSSAWQMKIFHMAIKLQKVLCNVSVAFSTFVIMLTYVLIDTCLKLTLLYCYIRWSIILIQATIEESANVFMEQMGGDRNGEVP